MNRKQVSKIEKKKLRLRIKKIMDAIKASSNLSFNYKLVGSIKNSSEMSIDAQGRIDIDVDILIKLKSKMANADEAYKHILSQIKSVIKDIETTKSQKRAIKINRPEFTIDIAIVDPFSEKDTFIVFNNGQGFIWKKY